MAEVIDFNPISDAEQKKLREVVIARGVHNLLEECDDPHRDGLIETPKRFIKAFREMTAGYHDDPAEILSKQFEQEEDSCEQYNGIVALRDIAFHSLCEHHLLPFYGTASVAYIPNSKHKKIVGISKLARLVECYSRRLQVQERLNAQITKAIADHLEADGVMVVIKARHMCMIARGVRQPNTEMITSEVRGVFRADSIARRECQQLLKL